MSKFENMTFENFLIEAPEADHIKDLRMDLGLSAAQCAKLAGLSDGALWRKYEQEKDNQINKLGLYFNGFRSAP
jgi:transcriptional regulator with XRE-family HTH domain